MRKLFDFAGLALCAWLVSAATAQAAKATLSVTFGERSLVSSLWYPDSLQVIRGVLVFTGGQGPNDQSGDTRGMADNKFYQRFAESIGFAVLGNQFTGTYTDASSGPGQALLDTLAALATQTNHPELARAPLLLEGFSNGGYFSFTFAKFQPKRVIAFALNKSGFTQATFDPEFLAVPGVLFWGEKEATLKPPSVIHGLVSQGRQQHALWAELKEWGRGHEEGDAERVFVPFFADMVAARYPHNKSPRDGDVPLIALDESQGYLGDHADASIESNLPTIASFAAYSGDKAAASWLPNEGIANLWRGFVTKTPVALDTPVSDAQLDATKLLTLSATQVTGGDSVSFLDGARELAGAAVSGGQAKANWMPAWGGGRGIVALVKSAGSVTRTSRPSAIVLYGKDPPPGPPQPEPSADPAGAGSGAADAGVPAGGVTTEPKDAGVRATVDVDVDSAVPDAGESVDAGLDSGQPEDASLAADGGDAGVEIERPRARTHRTRGSEGCNATHVNGGVGPLPAVFAAALFARSLRRRRRHRLH